MLHVHVYICTMLYFFKKITNVCIHSIALFPQIYPKKLLLAVDINVIGTRVDVSRHIKDNIHVLIHITWAQTSETTLTYIILGLVEIG